ncbi:MAG: hypothetical protein GY944_29560 [bacterium]|nr:hypothetical protein [bacterium]
MSEKSYFVTAGSFGTFRVMNSGGGLVAKGSIVDGKIALRQGTIPGPAVLAAVHEARTGEQIRVPYSELGDDEWTSRSGEEE